jgi:hypothetical protein
MPQGLEVSRWIALAVLVKSRTKPNKEREVGFPSVSAYPRKGLDEPAPGVRSTLRFLPWFPRRLSALKAIRFLGQFAPCLADGSTAAIAGLLQARLGAPCWRPFAPARRAYDPVCGRPLLPTSPVTPLKSFSSRLVLSIT